MVELFLYINISFSHFILISHIMLNLTRNSVEVGGSSSLGHRGAGLQEPISGARGAPVYPISALHHTPLHHLRHQLRRNPNPQTQHKKIVKKYIYAVFIY